jgi:hypothetical protein
MGQGHVEQLDPLLAFVPQKKLSRKPLTLEKYRKNIFFFEIRNSSFCCSKDVDKLRHNLKTLEDDIFTVQKTLSMRIGARKLRNMTKINKPKYKCKITHCFKKNETKEIIERFIGG